MDKTIQATNLRLETCCRLVTHAVRMTLLEGRHRLWYYEVETVKRQLQILINKLAKYSPSDIYKAGIYVSREPISFRGKSYKHAMFESTILYCREPIILAIKAEQVVSKCLMEVQTSSSSNQDSIWTRYCDKIFYEFIGLNEYGLPGRNILHGPMTLKPQCYWVSFEAIPWCEEEVYKIGND